MKRILMSSIFLITFSIYAQKVKTILHFKTGDSIVGFSKGINYESIKFSIDKKGGYKKADIENIDKVILYYKEGKEEYHHLYVKKKKKEEEFFARLVSKGIINHYIYSSNFSQTYASYKKINVGNGTVINQTTYNNTTHNLNLFYLKKKNDKYSAYISDIYYSIFGEKKFRKNAIPFFNDCPKLVKKIKSKEFKKSDIIEIIEFYNNECN